MTTLGDLERSSTEYRVTRRRKARNCGSEWEDFISVNQKL